ncbi:MAG: lipopolysaccharide heptosyltransferase II [Dehalococcoidia bacterium]|nr:lipopolysaccharide heptosyltransferase II [Dehalococcoidia bacterium]
MTSTKTISGRRLKNWLRHFVFRAVWLIAAVIGLAALPFGRRRGDFDRKSISKILVIRLDLLGDLVLSLPAIQALHEAYPDASISLLALPYTAPLFSQHPDLKQIFTFDVNRLRPSGEMLSPRPYRDLWNLLRRLRAEHFDLAVSLHGPWSSLFAFASGAPFRAGYRDESFPFMLNLAIPGKRYRQRRHEADYCLDLAYSLGAPAGAYVPVLTPSPEAIAAIDRLIGKGLGDFVIIHPGATNGAAKRWTSTGMAALADKLIGGDNLKVVFTGSKGDLPVVEAVTKQMRCTPLVLAGKTTIPELVALIARCRLLVSGDTGPMHIANALGVPVVAIHGPTDPALSGPYGGSATVVRHDVPCGPCYDLSEVADCPRHDPICMTSITVEEVYAAAKRQIVGRHR